MPFIGRFFCTKQNGNNIMISLPDVILIEQDKFKEGYILTMKSGKEIFIEDNETELIDFCKSIHLCEWIDEPRPYNFTEWDKKIKK